MGISSKSQERPRRRPRIGEQRRKQQPLKIDRLPVEVRDAIQYLKNVAGKTWAEIEELSALPYSEKWQSKGGGFVNWHALSTDVLEIFPDLRLAQTTLGRWYDLRVRQVMADVQRRSMQARELAAAFAKSVVAKDDQAVLNAARDQLMSLLAEDASPKARINATKGLIALAEMMQQARANTIKERKVATDERKMALLEDRERIARRKLEAETEKAAAKLKKGELTVTDINRLRERVFGLPPVEAAAHA
jgi:hypothetical protein